MREEEEMQREGGKVRDESEMRARDRERKGERQ